MVILHLVNEYVVEFRTALGETMSRTVLDPAATGNPLVSLTYCAPPFKFVFSENPERLPPDEELSVMKLSNPRCSWV